jgi:GTPase
MFDLPETNRADATRPPVSGNRAVLVSLDLAQPDHEESIAELRLLVKSARLANVSEVRGKVIRPDPATYAGSGKVQEIAAMVESARAGLAVFNHELSPAQQRNLERALNARVIDRVALILDIFRQRAKSAEGKLQVELAQLERLRTRLVRGWTHLERQRGGIGLRGGPGEKQIELDKRMLAKRVSQLRERLDSLRKQRTVRRSNRRRTRVFTVSLVGYTNAGKSTLFNRLTRSRAHAADQLFATLDTTTRRVFLAPDIEATLSDTVGFIRDLPHALIAAFRATLEEVAQADLLLHVVDAVSSAREQHIEQVNAVLAEIGAEHVPQILVYNKIDALPENQRDAAAVDTDEYGNIRAIRVSALQDLGIDRLREGLSQIAQAARETHPPSQQVIAG